MGKRIKNYIPHAIKIYAAEDVDFDNKGMLRILGPEVRPMRVYVPDNKSPARAESVIEKRGMVDDIPLYHIIYGRPVNLPEYKASVYIIVSALTAQAAQRAGRRTDDLLIPSCKVYSCISDHVIGYCGFSVL